MARKFKYKFARFARNFIKMRLFSGIFNHCDAICTTVHFYWLFSLLQKVSSSQFFSAFYSQQRPFCGKWRSKNGLRMLSMAKRLGSMFPNSPLLCPKNRHFLAWIVKDAAVQRFNDRWRRNAGWALTTWLELFLY